MDGLHVKFLLVAEDDVTIRLVGHLLFLKLHDVLQGDVRQGVVDALVDVVVYALHLGTQPGVDEPELSGALAGQTFGEGFLGDAKGLLALRHIVKDLQEVTDSIHHLVVLRDDVGEEILRLVGVVGFHIGSVCIVCQTASLTHLLEHDGVHATAIILVKQSFYCRLFGVPFALFVVDHAHVDVLGIVRGNDDFVFGSGLQFIVLALRNGLQFGHGLMVLGDGLGHLFCGHRAIVKHGVFIVLEVLQEVEELLRVELTDLFG